MCDKKEQILYFNVIAKSVRVNGAVKVDKYCNSAEVINIGPNVATVNQIPLNPPAAGEVLGDSWTFGGNRAEVYDGRIDVSFPVGAATQQVLILQKIYSTDSVKCLTDGCK